MLEHKAYNMYYQYLYIFALSSVHRQARVTEEALKRKKCSKNKNQDKTMTKPVKLALKMKPEMTKKVKSVSSYSFYFRICLYLLTLVDTLLTKYYEHFKI